MNVSKNEMVISDEEYLALITVAKYQFYKEYVEDLEKAYDDLEKAYDDLSLENAKLQERYLSLENARLREQNKLLVSKNKNLKSILEKYRGY